MSFGAVDCLNQNLILFRHIYPTRQRYPQATLLCCFMPLRLITYARYQATPTWLRHMASGIVAGAIGIEDGEHTQPSQKWRLRAWLLVLRAHEQRRPVTQFVFCRRLCWGGSSNRANLGIAWRVGPSAGSENIKILNIGSTRTSMEFGRVVALNDELTLYHAVSDRRQILWLKSFASRKNVYFASLWSTCRPRSIK